MRIGVVTFPGSLDDSDAARAVRVAGGEAVALWHADSDLHSVDAVVLPGGFSYGDYLRCGAIARFSPIMDEIIRLAGSPDASSSGLPVLGICNGFQVLCESHLLPGALVRNQGQRFVCKDQPLIVERTDTAWTNQYQADQHIVIPLKHGEGRYIASPTIIDELEGESRVVVRYLPGTNPNGSTNDIAGISNASGTVVGLMPHPEHAVQEGFGSDRSPVGVGHAADGLAFFTSVLSSLVAA